MKQAVVLAIRGRQRYADQDPEIIELVTEGSMTAIANGWDISYEESDLTGLAGTTTTFRVEPACVTLTREGPLSSQMIFRQGVPHESLYQMPFGAMMITVCANKVTGKEVATFKVCLLRCNKCSIRSVEYVNSAVAVQVTVNNKFNCCNRNLNSTL